MPSALRPSSPSPEQNQAGNKSSFEVSTSSSFTYKRLRRRLRLIGTICLVLVGASTLSSLTSVWQLVTKFSVTSLIFLGSGLFTVLLFLLAYYSVRLPKAAAATFNELDRLIEPKEIADIGAKPLNTLSAAEWFRKLTRRADFVAYGLIAIFISFEALTQFSSKNVDGSLTAGFLIVPVAATLFGLSRRAILGVLIVTALVFAGSLLANSDRISDFYLKLFTWLLTYAVIAFCINIFAGWVWEAFDQEERQTEKLTELVTLLNSTNHAGVVLGQEMAGVTRELNTTVNQHASITQEQVAAMTEVTSNLEELNETAQQIATNASQAAVAVNQTVEIANRVKEASAVTEQTSREGADAVKETVVSVERVRNRIELLGQRLLNLTEQTGKVGSIIDIIDEIADETHLLALNASIEAAGNITNSRSGSTGSAGGTVVVQEHRTSVQGERFGVIAQEIKSLSGRSREATEEVRQAIAEMQGAVAAAVLVAEEGKKETAAAVFRSQIAGAVIGKLDRVIIDSADSADQILLSVGIARERCEEISLATGQQKSANSQILMIMRSVTQASHEGAKAVSHFTSVVGRVKHQVEHLNSILTNSRTQV